MLKSKQNVSSLETADNIYLNKLLKGAYKVPFAMEKDVFQILSDCYAPQLISCGNALGPSGFHQLGSAHLIIAEQILRKYVENLSEYIEIGPNASAFVKHAVGKKNPHGCTLRSSRDQIRHLKSAMSNIVRGYNPTARQLAESKAGGVSHANLYLDVQALAAGIPTETFCLTGWQNCSAVAPVAIANHSLYDISLMDLAVGMRNHQTSHIRAFMHFPTEVLDVDEWKSVEKGYAFKRVRDGKKDQIMFTWIGDSAFGYIHDYKTWMDYLLLGGMETPFGFSLVIEKTSWRGSQFEVNISRTTSGGRLFYSLPNSLSDLIKVPNFRKIAATDFCKRAFDPSDIKNYVVTDGSKVRKLKEFVDARQAKAFSLETVKGYARTLVSEIRLGGQIAEHRWHVDSNDFTDLCTSIYLLSVYQRRQDETVVTAAFAHLACIGKKASIWDKLGAWLRDYLGIPEVHFEGSSHHDKQSARIASQKTSNIFHQATMQYFRDFESLSEVREAGYNTDFFFGYNCEEEPTVEPTREERAAGVAYDVANPPAVETAAEVPEWTRQFGVAVAIEAVHQNIYMAEAQHSILIAECEQAVNNADTPRGLKSVLEGAALALKTKKPDKLHLENIMALTGVPGGAKTGMVKQKIIPTSEITGPVLVLCPTRALAEGYSTDLTLPSLACTMHSGLRHVIGKVKWSLVIVEEAFTLPMAYINFVAAHHKVLLVGDSQQITHVDFSNLWAGCSKLEDFVKYMPRHHLTVTKRCPQDIALLPIIRAHYPGITSSSKKEKSVKFVNERYQDDQAVTICFTQLTKAQLTQSTGRVVYTAHECQGQTFSSVLLHYGGAPAENMLLKKSPNHLIVALTRHTNNLFIRDCSQDGELVTMLNEIQPLTIIADASNIDLNAVENVPVPVLVEIEDTTGSGGPYPVAAADVQSVDNIIGRIYGIPAPKENVATTSTFVPVPGTSRGTIRTGALGQEEQDATKIHSLYRLLAGSRVLNTSGKNKHMHMRTQMERLYKATLNLPTVVCDAMSEKLEEQLAEQFDWTVPENMFHRMYLDMMEKQELKGVVIDGLDDCKTWQDKYVCMVKSHLKAQQKPMLGKDPHEADKAGQGISAWGKTLNMYTGAWARALEQVMVNQSKGDLIILSQKTDKEAKVVLENMRRPGDKYVDNDWTQFDSNQNNLSREILRRLLTRVGCPDVILDPIMEQMASRTVACDTVTLLVEEKLDSGCPLTLIKNCAFNAAVMLEIIVNWRKMAVVGDDGMALGDNVSFNMEAIKKFTGECGYIFKPNESHSGQFVSFLVNTQGVAIDLPRICSKIIGRAYVDEADFINYQTAMSATAGPIDLATGANMCKVNAVHYYNSLRCEHDFDVLLSFLCRFARGDIKFSELYKSEAIYLKTDRPAMSERLPAVPLATPTTGMKKLVQNFRVTSV